MRPVIHYYGGAWRKSKQRLYPKPAYQTVVEPFAGGAGYSLFWEQPRVILCDLDPVICGIWDYLLHVTPEELLALPDLDGRTPLDELGFPCQEARDLAGFWSGVGSQYPARVPSKWCLDYARVQPGRFWTDYLRRRIARQLHLLRGWEIHHCSYQDLPQEYLEAEATWFVDPPYQDKGKHYRCGSADIDFGALGTWCQARQGQVIVCEQQGASWLPFWPAGEVQTVRNDLPSAEVVWLSDGRPVEPVQGQLWGGVA